jgi:hypothetical protein
VKRKYVNFGFDKNVAGMDCSLQQFLPRRTVYTRTQPIPIPVFVKRVYRHNFKPKISKCQAKTTIPTSAIEKSKNKQENSRKRNDDISKMVNNRGNKRL